MTDRPTPIIRTDEIERGSFVRPGAATFADAAEHLDMPGRTPE